jgi:hypothetical protein
MRLAIVVAFCLQAYQSVRFSSTNKPIQQVHALEKTSDELVAITAKKDAKVVDIDVSHIRLNAFELCLCGAFATAFGDIVMHPLDTIKVLQQAGGGLSILATARQIIATSGFFGLYQGVIPYCSADGLRLYD